MKKQMLTALLVLAATAARPQLVAPLIEQKYPPGVLSRIYEVALSTRIPHETQLQLAAVLYTKDSLVAAAVKNESSLRQIKDITDSMQATADRLITGEYRVRLLHHLYKKVAEGIAKAEAVYYSQQYGIDVDTENNLYATAVSRQIELLKLAAAGNTVKKNDSAYRAIRRLDSVQQAFLIIARGQQYFDDMAKTLNALRPLSDTETNCLRKQFKIQCFKRGGDYHKNFNAAMQLCVKDSLYFNLLYADSLKGVAAVKVQQELNEYIYKYNLTPADVDSIRPVIAEKVRSCIWFDTKYPNGRLRNDLYAQTSERSWLEIKSKLIRNGYTALGTSRISNAVRHQKILRLSAGQLDTLCRMDYSFDLMITGHKYLNAGAVPNYAAAVERAGLKMILREGQYDTLIYNESLLQAKSNAANDWQRILKLRLAPAGDSSDVVKQLTNFHLRVLIVTERYMTEPAIYRETLNELWRNKPDLLRRADEQESITAGDRLKSLW